MKTRLAVAKEAIPESALEAARLLYDVDADSTTVEEHNEKIKKFVDRYGMGVWFSAIEVVRQEIS
jgi:hypothetical protein